MSDDKHDVLYHKLDSALHEYGLLRHEFKICHMNEYGKFNMFDPNKPSIEDYSRSHRLWFRFKKVKNRIAYLRRALLNKSNANSDE